MRRRTDWVVPLGGEMVRTAATGLLTDHRAPPPLRREIWAALATEVPAGGIAWLARLPGWRYVCPLQLLQRSPKLHQLGVFSTVDFHWDESGTRDGCFVLWVLAACGDELELVARFDREEVRAPLAVGSIVVFDARRPHAVLRRGDMSVRPSTARVAFAHGRVLFDQHLEAIMGVHRRQARWATDRSIEDYIVARRSGNIRRHPA